MLEPLDGAADITFADVCWAEFGGGEQEHVTALTRGRLSVRTGHLHITLHAEWGL